MSSARIGPFTPAQVVEGIVRSLVVDQDAVAVTERPGSKTTVIEVRVNPGNKDHGRLVGRSGRNVMAIKDLLVSLGGRSKHSFQLDLLDGHFRQTEDGDDG